MQIVTLVFPRVKAISDDSVKKGTSLFLAKFPARQGEWE